MDIAFRAIGLFILLPLFVIGVTALIVHHTPNMGPRGYLPVTKAEDFGCDSHIQAYTPRELYNCFKRFEAQ